MELIGVDNAFLTGWVASKKYGELPKAAQDTQ